MKTTTKKVLEAVVVIGIVGYIISKSDDRALLILCALGILYLVFKNSILKDFENAEKEDRWDAAFKSKNDDQNN